MTREIIRRIQIMRKEMKLTRLDLISLYANVDEETKKLLQNNKSQIMQIVKAKTITINQDIPQEAHRKNLDILGDKVELGILKA